MPVTRRQAPAQEEDIRAIKRRTIFQKLQKKLYEAGKQGKKFEVIIISIVMDDFSMRRFMSKGVMKCLQDEWKRGTDAVI